MLGHAKRRRAAVLIASAVVLSGCSAAPSAAPSTASADYQRAYSTGLEAYTYGLPLLVTDATFRTMTSVDVSQGAYGPVNTVNNVRGTNTSSSTAVVAPGSTSLSSIAWLDLRAEPQVLHVPTVKDHFFVLALIDPYTENLVNLGTASSTAPGDYVITTPEQSGVALPAGTRRVAVDHWRIWLIGSTQVKGPDDVATVDRIQDGYTLTPLSRYGKAPSSPAPAPSSSPTPTAYKPPTDITFFDELGRQLTQFPPPAADGTALARFATVGIGPGRTPSTDTTLSADTRNGLADAVAAGPARIQKDLAALVASDAPRHAGYLLGGFGRYGTDYTMRAVVSQIGLGAFVPEQAIYAMTWSDATGAALDGSSSYVLHMAAPPPSSEGWSVTLYSTTGALLPTASGRHALTDTSTLTRNADGSVDLYLQPGTPTDAARAANWLPTVTGQAFEITWRVFAPTASDIDGILDGSGWQPPAVEAADD